MIRSRTVLIVLTIGVLSSEGLAGAAKVTNGKELALRLADPATQDRAVAEVTARARVDIPPSYWLHWDRLMRNAIGRKKD
ncbi:MAG: hypothetical protein WA324_11310 [Bryobacteraceae bacterium]